MLWDVSYLATLRSQSWVATLWNRHTCRSNKPRHWRARTRTHTHSFHLATTPVDRKLAKTMTSPENSLALFYNYGCELFGASNTCLGASPPEGRVRCESCKCHQARWRVIHPRKSSATNIRDVTRQRRLRWRKICELHVWRTLLEWRVGKRKRGPQQTQPASTASCCRTQPSQPDMSRGCLCPPHHPCTSPAAKGRH